MQLRETEDVCVTASVLSGTVTNFSLTINQDNFWLEVAHKGAALLLTEDQWPELQNPQNEKITFTF